MESATFIAKEPIMYFFTATINSWRPLLQKDEFKTIIVNSLRWMDENQKAYTHGFVIMPNHIHLLWSYPDPDYDPEFALLSFTAHGFKKILKSTPEISRPYLSTQHDREYHYWERRSRAISMKSRVIANQKLDYIHNNPLQDKWKLAAIPEEYQYSSARFYMQLEQEFHFLKHYSDFI